MLTRESRTPMVERVVTPTPLYVWLWAIWQLVQRDLKVRYKNSALGFVWSFLNPLMQVLVLTVAFKFIMGAPTKNFSVELFTCLLPWMFFLQSLGDGTVCLIKDGYMLKKYAFPTIILPAVTIASNLFHLLLGYAVMFAVFIVVPVTFHWSFLWVIPLLAIQCVLILGLILVLAVAQIYYDDVRFLQNWILQLVFFLSPIVYTVQQVMDSPRLPDLAKELYLAANPITPLLIGYRAALLYGGQWPLPNFFFYLGISAGWAVLALVFGLWLFRRHERMLPELI
jgi:lipopolysaccharide transport system permease protein